MYELGADEKIVQRVLSQAKSHVTKDRTIKAFDPAVMAAMKKLEATVDLVNQSAPRVHQILSSNMSFRKPESLLDAPQ